MPKYRGFMYAPPGSPFCPPTALDGCYNTGRINSDALPGAACLDPDPRQFGSMQEMLAYAQSNAEPLMEIASIAELNKICAQGLHPVQVITPQPPPTISPTPGAPAPGPPPGTVPPLATPPPMGTTPPIDSGPYTPPVKITGGGNVPIYRLILESNEPYHRFDTGATLPGCTASHAGDAGGPCDGQQFDSLANAVAYANSRGEVPVIVHSTEEAMQILSGAIGINPEQIVDSSSLGGMDLTTIAAIGIGALLILPRLLKKKASS